MAVRSNPDIIDRESKSNHHNCYLFVISLPLLIKKTNPSKNKKRKNETHQKTTTKQKYKIEVPASSLTTQKNGVENSKSWIQGPGGLPEARSHREDSRGAGIFENRRVPTPFKMENVNHVYIPSATPPPTGDLLPPGGVMYTTSHNETPGPIYMYKR